MSDPLGMGPKRALIRAYAERYPRQVYIETGIYNGHCTAHELADLFRHRYVIDNDLLNVERAGKYGHPPVLILGDSALKLPSLLASLGCPAFVFLDAHTTEPAEGDTSPLLTEISALGAWEFGKESVILIDDIRQMGVEPGWPTLDEVYAKLDAWAFWWVGEDSDILVCTPR